MPTLDQLKAKLNEQLKLPLEQVSIVNLVNLFIETASTAQASDVHIEPEAHGVRVRYRVDGILQDIFGAAIPLQLQPEIISRIKVISGLRTDEHLAPQDGRFRMTLDNSQDVDVRVSIAPTYHGENAVLRVLAQSHDFTLESLGLSAADLARVEKAMRKPYGMILANGPTGSGKSTTLYTILKRLNKPEISVITIEDPIEYSLEGTTQMQVNTQTGFTFANGLRSILRQDPNIVMVGEIRDGETAEISVQAALTGHLVLSTLHTNDAATTFPRLIDMGVPPFLVASTVNIAMGQRLVRTLCQKCKVQRTLTADEQKSVREIIPEITEHGRVFYKAQGCDACNGLGYQGRIGVREVLEVNEEIRKLILNRATAQEIKNAAVKAGMTTMVMDSLAKAAAGITSIEEVLRVIHE